VNFVPVSGLHGNNLRDLVDRKWCKWYEGPTLFQLLDNCDLPTRDEEGPLLIPIFGKIVNEKGEFISGRIERGKVKIGEKVTILPHYIQCKVASIMNSNDEYVEYGRTGEFIYMELKIIDDKINWGIYRGHCICSPDSHTEVSDLFEVELDIFQLPKNKPIITCGYTCMIHIHTCVEEATIVDIMELDKEEGEEVKTIEQPIYAKSYSAIKARVSTRVPICFEMFDYFQRMGAFVLRDGDNTIGSGIITKFKPSRIGDYNRAEEEKQNKCSY